ncbi:hypothetical protein TOK_3762 [Pseudonocardia sp. N23]|nr:hypothetical protein TOK_3762 [Pseudonocardia sp. N23]
MRPPPRHSSNLGLVSGAGLHDSVCLSLRHHEAWLRGEGAIVVGGLLREVSLRDELPEFPTLPGLALIDRRRRCDTHHMCGVQPPGPAAHPTCSRRSQV